MKAEVVIGANWGDEGKGKITDYLASLHKGDCTVVRFNSSAQAGHTVQVDGKRHAFGHFGAGSFAGATTYLSEFFVVNPILFRKELNALNMTPKVLVHPDCMITTPYDILINQLVEDVRTKKHGSCGVGFNETIERNLNYFSFKMNDLWGSYLDILHRGLNSIRTNWVPMRLKTLGVTDIPDKYKELFNNPEIINNYIKDLLFFLTYSLISDTPDLDKPVIFEGAQGLLLDQNHKWFPHVTRSNTGLKNVVKLAQDWGIDELNTNYVTRSYMTRHGEGPFPVKPLSPLEDKTNVFNKYQGNMRFGHLDLALLKETIQEDLKNADKVKVNPFLAVTCLDQIGPDRLTTIRDISTSVGLPVRFEGFGAERKSIFVNVNVNY